MKKELAKLENGHSPGCYKLRMKYNANWEQRFLLVSDIHFDALHSNHKLLKKHLEQALEYNAPIFIFGDLLDLMQGKQDPRASKSEINPKYAVDDDYLGNVCADAAAFLAPYASHILLMAMGNHEYEYRRRHEVDPLTMVSTMLKAATGFMPVVAPYSGWLQLKYQHATGGNRSGHNLKWHHGTGSNSPVTRGAISTNRFSVMYPNADIQVRGHINQRFQMFIPRETVTTQGRIVTDNDALHLQLGCYVQDNLDGNSWSQRRGMGTAAIGGFWLRLYCDGTKKAIRFQATATD